MSPEKGPFQKDVSFSNCQISGDMLCFLGSTLTKPMAMVGAVNPRYGVLTLLTVGALMYAAFAS